MPEGQITDELKELMPDMNVNTGDFLYTFKEALGKALQTILPMLRSIISETMRLLPKIIRGKL